VAYSKNIYLAVDKLPASTQLIQQMRVASWLRIRTSYPYTPCSVFRTPVLWVFRTFRTFPVTLQIRIPLPYFRCLARTSTGWLIFRCRCENSARNERVFGRWPTFIVSPPCFFCGVAVQFVVPPVLRRSSASLATLKKTLLASDYFQILNYHEK